jgi:hypothetical protein
MKTLKIAEEDFAALKEFCKKRGILIQFAATEAIRAYLKAKKNP